MIRCLFKQNRPVARQLKETISALEQEVAAAMEPTQPTQPTDHQARRASKQARSFLEEAVANEKRCRVHQGWIAVHHAQECLMETLSDARVFVERDHVLGLADEMETMARREWAKARIRHIRDLLGDGFQSLKQDQLVEKRHRLRRALEARNRYWDFIYREADLVSTRIGILAAVLLVAAVATVLAAWGGLFKFLEPNGSIEFSGRFLTSVGILGFLGGGLSSAIVLATTLKDVISDHARMASWHIARPVVGAVSAIVAVAIAAGGFGFAPTSSATYLGIAAAAGFSETFLEGLVEKVAKGKKG